MKLLIDENLSDRLATSLQDCFPDSRHVRNLGLRGSLDSAIWQTAQEGGFCILTKDNDFQARSLMEGSPPKVVLIRIGNCTTERVEIAVRNSLERLSEFEADPNATMIVLP